MVATDEIELFARLKLHIGQGAFVQEYGLAQRDHSGNRVSRAGGIGPDPSAYIVIKKIFGLVKGTHYDNSVERNAIARFGCGAVEAYALSGEFTLASKSLEFSHKVANGKKRIQLWLLLGAKRLMAAEQFYKLFVYLRSRQRREL